MFAAASTLRRSRGGPTPGRLRHLLAGSAIVAILTLGIQNGLQAADCPAPRQPSIPAPDIQRFGDQFNISVVKQQLRDYHKDNPAGAENSAYVKDIKLVIDDALAYVTSRAAAVEKPAVVLDIDETSLSNWRNLEVDDFGFIEGGSCALETGQACGFDAWIMRAEASRIGPTLEFYKAVRAKQVAVFFITGRRDSQREATIRNLRREGYEDWTGLITRPDDDKDSTIVPFKSGWRAIIESGDKNWGYKVLASVGDQQSDLKGDHAECPFKLPNPFYFIR